MLTAATVLLLTGLPSAHDGLTLCTVTVPDIVRQAVALRLQGLDEYTIVDRISPRIPAGVNDPMAYTMAAMVMREIYVPFAFLYGTMPEAYRDPAFLRYAVSMAESSCLDSFTSGLPVDD